MVLRDGEDRTQGTITEEEEESLEERRKEAKETLQKGPLMGCCHLKSM